MPWCSSSAAAVPRVSDAARTLLITTRWGREKKDPIRLEGGTGTYRVSWMPIFA